MKEKYFFEKMNECLGEKKENYNACLFTILNKFISIINNKLKEVNIIFKII